MKNIPYSTQDINEDDIASVVNILNSGFLTTGPAIKKFEDSVKNFCKAKNAIALSNGTAALHIALLALNIGKDDIIWTSPISFVASANCALYVGASVDFVDCCPLFANIDVIKLEEKLIEAKKNNKLPDAVIIVHFSGRTCDMEKISKLAKLYNFKIIEDAAHALGAYYKDHNPVGCGKYSDITTFSFHPVKSIATGEGGMIVTQNDELAKRARLLLSHGVTRDESLMQNQKHGPWYYEQLELGYNYRITDIQCTLGVSQMNRLKSFIDRRNEIAKKYNNQLSSLPLILPKEDNNSSWHLYVIQLDDTANISRLELFEKLRDANIGVNVHYIPIYQQPYYQKIGFKDVTFSNAEKYYNRCISIPIFPKMTNEEQGFIIDKLKEFLS